jgi:Mce-associated membrane protein
MTTDCESTVSADADVSTSGPPKPAAVDISGENETDRHELADDTRGDLATDADAGTEQQQSTAIRDPGPRIRHVSWPRIVAVAVLPAIALILAATSGYLKWQDALARQSQTAGVQSVSAAVESTIALLSYHPDTVDKDLTAARDRLTGQFKDAYTSLTHDVVIPAAKQKQISAVATVPAAGSVLATENRAVVILFVDQTTTFGSDPPTNISSAVRITLDKVHNRWLISQFDPV